MNILDLELLSIEPCICLVRIVAARTIAKSAMKFLILAKLGR